MTDANDIVIEALLDDVLDASMLVEAVDEALGIVQGEANVDPTAAIETQLQRLEFERQRLIKAVGAGRMVTGVLEALQALETRKATLEQDRAAIAPQRRVPPSDAARIRQELLALSASWRRVLAHDPMNARPIIASLLTGRVTITPSGSNKDRIWEMRGEGTLAGLLSREIFPVNLASPPGFGPWWNRKVPL